MALAGWLLAGYLAGALLLVLFEERWRPDELAALALWPLQLLAAPIAWVLRRRRRCPDCGKRYLDRETMLRHRARAGVHL